MVNLFLLEPNWKEDFNGDSEFVKMWISLLNQLESAIWSLMTAGGRSEARFWLGKSISTISSIRPRQQRELFVNLLRTKGGKGGLTSQLLQMIFEKRPHKAGSIIAKKSHVLENFFEGHQTRILQWFSNYADTGGLEQTKGAKALAQFAFVNRDICWEELEWKGKHGQSPAVVATKPHYLLDLDTQRTVENFLENVPEFWSSNEFADSLKDGDILSIDTKFFERFFIDLMYKEDSEDVWEIINEFLMEESFSSLCHHLLISLEEQEFCSFLKLLSKYLNPRRELSDFGNPSHWLELVLSKFSGSDSIDLLLLLNAVISQGRQLLHLVHDEESREDQAKIMDIVTQICTITSNKSMVPVLSECSKIRTTEAVKLLGLQSWALYYALSEEYWTPESWESLFSNNGISFQKSDRYALLNDNGLSEENESELDDRASLKRKSRKKKKEKKKRKRNPDDDDIYDYDMLDFDASNNRLGVKARSWLLSTDGFSASWTNVDLPEHLSKFCFSTWMKWAFAKRNNMA